MATWVRAGTGSDVTGTDANVQGVISLDNGTAPSDFNPVNVTSVRLQWRFTVSGIVDDNFLDARRCRLIGNGSDLASTNQSDATRTTNGTWDHDFTDSAPSTSDPIADWEAAGIDGLAPWATYNASMMPDGTTGTIVAANCTVTITYTPDATLDQVTYRYRDDDDTESAATWRVAENTNDTLEVDTNYRMRFTLDDTASGQRLNFRPQLEYNLAGGGWNDVTNVSSVIRSNASGNFVDEDDTTRQLSIPTGGTFITPNSGMDETSGVAGEQDDIDFVNTTHDFVEVEFCFQIRSGDVTDAQTVQLRIKNADAWTVTPTITINKATPTITQQTHRIRLDLDVPNSEASGWSAAQGADATLEAEQTVRIRFRLAATEGTFADGYQLRWQKNGAGGYVAMAVQATPIAPAITPVAVESTDSSQYTNNTALTSALLTGGTGSFVNGWASEQAANTSSISVPAGDFTEVEFAVRIRKYYWTGSAVAESIDTDFYDFRVYLDDGTALNGGYDDTPRITVDSSGLVGGCWIEAPHVLGPYVDTNDNTYFFMEAWEDKTPGGETLALKSTDGGVSWTAQDIAGSPTQTDFEGGVAVQSNSVQGVIHLASHHGTDVYYHEFNTSDRAATPAVVSVGTVYNTGGTGVTAHNISVPGSMTPGNMLLVILGYDGGGGSSSTDLTEFLDDAHSTSSVGMWMGYRTIDGTEGSTVLVTSGVAENAVGWAIEIENWGGLAPELSSKVEANTSDPDPPSFTPSGGAIGRLWIPAFAVNGGITTPLNAYPYSSGTNRDDATGGSGAVGAGFSALSQTVSTDNPAIFDGTTTNDTMVWTMTIEGPRPDTWGVIDRAVTTGLTTPGVGLEYVSMAQRSDSDLVVFYNHNTTLDTEYKISTDDGATWGSANNLDATASENQYNAWPVTAESDLMYIFYMVEANAMNNDTAAIFYKTLSGADSLSGRTSLTAATLDSSAGDRGLIFGATYYDDGGDEVVHMVYADSADGTTPFIGKSILIRNGGTPDSTKTATDNPVDSGADGGGSNQADAITVVRAASKELHILYADETSIDLFYTTETDDGGWDTDTEQQDAVTVGWVRGNVVTRGGADYLAYVYDDGTGAATGGQGPVYYSEILLSEAVAPFPPFRRRQLTTVRM